MIEPIFIQYILGNLGVLFEIATDPPGFTLDQKVEDLGERLMLPKWLEPVRERLEKVLPRIDFPNIIKIIRNKENKQ